MDRVQIIGTWLVLCFLAAIFYGDIWIGITLPLSVLLLPPLIAVSGPIRVSGIPAGFFLLSSLALIVGVQTLTAWPPRGQQDLVVYLPIFYAAIAIFALRNRGLSDRHMKRVLWVGGLLSAVTMLLVAIFMPTGEFLVPGQASWRTDLEYREEIARRREQLPPEKASAIIVTDPRLLVSDTGTETAVSAPVRQARPPITADEQQFYYIKSLFRNALGVSNYIAVFFVFVATVSLFAGSLPLAALFAACAALTFSRFAMVFLAITAVVWVADRRYGKRCALAALALAVATGMALVYFTRDASIVPTSLSIRAAYWLSGLEAISNRPLFGAPRSYILDAQNISILWNPHNSLIHYAAIFGLVGLAIYLVYAVVVLRTFGRLMETSAVWKGIFYGFAILYAWSFFESIALTPAFEILIASLYALALNVRQGATNERARA